MSVISSSIANNMVSNTILFLVVVVLYHSSIVYSFNIVLAGGTGKVGEVLVRYGISEHNI